jgi:hypothetical protein
MTLKIAWAVWLSATLAVMVWRRRGRTVPVRQSAHDRSVEAAADRSPSKRRWRLRASDSPALQTSSLLGL